MRPVLQHRVAVGERQALACAVSVLVSVSGVSAWLALVSPDLSAVHAPPLFPHSLRGLCAPGGALESSESSWFVWVVFTFLLLILVSVFHVGGFPHAPSPPWLPSQ